MKQATTQSLLLEDLMSKAKAMGIAVGMADIPSGLFIPAEAMQEKVPNSPPVILLPRAATSEKQTWILAHELGHAVLGHRVGLKPRIIQEIEAWHWAKRMLRKTP